MITTADPAPPTTRPRISAFAMGRRCQILRAVTAGDAQTAANLITNSPGLDWRALIPADHHAAVDTHLRG